MIGTADCARMVSHTLKPLAPGMLMSSTTRSGPSLSKRVRAAVPSGALTARNPACESVKAISSSRSRSSSAIRTFMAGATLSTGGAVRLDRQCKTETGVLLRCTLHDDGAAVTLDHGFDDPQAQTQTARFR